MSLNSLVRWWVRRSPLRYQKLRGHLLSARMGMTLERYLTVSLTASVLAGIG
jgi:hypothetical protein